MSSNVFVGDQVILDVSFDAARCQLRRLASDGLLLGISEYAYATGVTDLAEAGLAAASAQLAGVRSGDLMETGERARLPLRWQEIGPDGALFPALDADLTLSPAGQATTVLALAGVYRLPAPTAAGLDPAIVRCLADVTIRSFIARLACALTHPAGAAIPAGRALPEACVDHRRPCPGARAPAS
jgi:hypothetical protein